MRAIFVSEAMIDPQLKRFESITLQELDNVKLQNRVDTKYVFHYDDLSSLLEELMPHYTILNINERRLFNYDTLYFDTPDFQLYRMHHNGKPNRFKVRYRNYVDSGEIYFEIKHKVKDSRTIKKRYRRDVLTEELGSDELNKLGLLNADWIWQKKIRTHFKRITLAGKNHPERVTIDLNTQFDNLNASKIFPQLVIAEIKQDKGSVLSPAIKAFKKRHFAEAGFSKYCAGVAMLESIKHNAFKPKLIKINKIIYGNNGSS